MVIILFVIFIFVPIVVFDVVVMFIIFLLKFIDNNYENEYILCYLWGFKF